MHMAEPIPQFTHFVRNLAAAHPDLAYIHAVESEAPAGTAESNDFMRKIWAPRPFITCQGYTRETAIARADATGDLVAFGKAYIANVRRYILEYYPFL
jgi:NADPH2 dehydrogenase